MLSLFAALAIAVAVNDPATAPAPAPAAVATTAPVTASANPARRRGRTAHVATVKSPPSNPDAAALEEQQRMRILFPALSGDGGG